MTDSELRKREAVINAAFEDAKTKLDSATLVERSRLLVEISKMTTEMLALLDERNYRREQRPLRLSTGW